MKQSLFIEQIMVIGEGQKMPAALFNRFEYVEAWAQENNIDVGKTSKHLSKPSID